MKKILINDQWFRRTGFKAFDRLSALETEDGKLAGPYAKETVPKTAVPVTLPDDFIIHSERKESNDISNANGYFPGDAAKYWRYLYAPNSWQGKKIILDLDGAYMNTEIRLNNNYLGKHPYGYSPFQIDLDSYLEYGKDNLLRIDLMADTPNNRWYSGGGIYRDVHLWVGGEVYIRPWNMEIETVECDRCHARIRLKYIIENNKQEESTITVKYTLYDPDGLEIWHHSQAKSLKEQQCLEMTELLDIDEPQLWDLDNPFLYTLSVSLIKNQCIEDESEFRFGIRKIEISAKMGMRLNGKPIKLYGAAIHSEYGALGLKMFRACEKRRLIKLKKLGYNSIRGAHNPVSNITLELCDELGILVLEEIFDVWVDMKQPKDYHRYFEEWWEKDMTYTIKRDRNHPSIWCYSIGNEIKEIARDYGKKYVYLLTKKAHELDSTRPVMAALNGMSAIGYGNEEPDNILHFGTKKFNLQKSILASPNYVAEDEYDPWGDETAEVCAMLDVVGQNYMHRRAEHDHAKWPDRIVVTTESTPYDSYDAWQITWRNPFLLGNYVWCGVDFLGEAGTAELRWEVDEGFFTFRTGWPWISSFQGDLDMILERKPQSYYRAVLWGLEKVHLFSVDPINGTKHPATNGWSWDPVCHDWTYPESMYHHDTRCVCYAQGSYVEYILNGKTAARTPIIRFCSEAVVPYEPGVLEAVVYDEQDRIVAKDCITTAKKPAKMILSVENETILANSQDLSFVKVVITDENGQRIYHHDQDIAVQVEGAGILVGIGSGNPCTEESFNLISRKSWNGAILAVIQSLDEPGEVKVRFTSDGLAPAECTVSVVKKEVKGNGI